MTNNRYISKDARQIVLLFLLLIVQITVLTKLVKYDRIKKDIGIHEDSEIDGFQSNIEDTTDLPNLDFDADADIDIDDYLILSEKIFLLQKGNLNQEDETAIKAIIELLDKDDNGDISSYEWEDYIG